MLVLVDSTAFSRDELLKKGMMINMCCDVNTVCASTQATQAFLLKDYNEDTQIAKQHDTFSTALPANIHVF